MVTSLMTATFDLGSSAQDAADQEANAVYDTSLFFFPGMYCPSGFDLMKILYCVAIRPHPTIDLGPVDASCPIVLCDLYLPDTPVVYASDSFLALTGYTQDEVLGRNCRFLQWPGHQEQASQQSQTAPSSYVPPRVRQLLHQSVKHSREVQVEVTNFRKDGTPFVNFLSVVPIYWDDDDWQADHGSSPNGSSRSNEKRRQSRRHRYSVGFVCDKSAME